MGRSYYPLGHQRFGFSHLETYYTWRLWFLPPRLLNDINGIDLVFSFGADGDVDEVRFTAVICSMLWSSVAQYQSLRSDDTSKFRMNCRARQALSSGFIQCGVFPSSLPSQNAVVF